MYPAADLDVYRKHAQKSGQVTTCICRLNFHSKGNKKHIFLTNGQWQKHNVEEPLCSYENTNVCLIWAPSILHCNKYARCSATPVRILYVAAQLNVYHMRSLDAC